MLSRMLNLRPSEGPKVIMLTMMFFLFIIGTTWAETIVESSYYYLAGVSHLSQVFTLHAIVSLVFTLLYSAFADRGSNQRLLAAVCAIAGLAICGALLLLKINQILAYTILYVLVRAVRTSFVIHWWNYAGDYYDSRAAKRIIPVINAGSRIAIILAGLTIPLLNLLFTTTTIILLWVVTLLAIASLSWLMNSDSTGSSDTRTCSNLRNRLNLRKSAVQTVPVLAGPRPVQTDAKTAHTTTLGNIKEGFKYVSSSSYLRWVSLSTFLMVIIFAILNYQGGLIIKESFGSRAEITNFIGTLNGLTSLVMLPVQLFMFSRIVARIGVGNANVFFPLGTLLISSGVIFAPLSLASAAFAHFDRNTFRYSTQETSNNLLYNAVPAHVKGRSRSFVDGLILPVALLVSSAVLEFGKLLPANLFLPILLGLPALAFLLCSLIIRRKYSQAMITLLEQEDYVSLLPSAPTDGELMRATDPATIHTLLKILAESHDDAITLLLARVTVEADIKAALPILETKTRESNAALRAGIIGVLADADGTEKSLQQFYEKYLGDPDPQVRLAAFLGLQQNPKSNSSFLDLAAGLLSDASPKLRAEALVALFQSNQSDSAGSSTVTAISQAEAALQELLKNSDAQARASAIDALGKSGLPRFLPTLLTFLQDGDGEVRLRATLASTAIYHRVLEPSIEAAILAAGEALLHDPLERVRLATLVMLEQVHTKRSIDLILLALFDTARAVRNNAAEILVKFGTRAAPGLELALTQNPDQGAVLKAALCRIDVRKYGVLVDEQIMTEMKAIYERHSLLNDLRDLPAQPGLSFLRSLLAELNQDNLQVVFELLAARYGAKSVNRISQSFASSISAMRANASEALDAVIDSSLRKLIHPVLEHHPSAADLAEIGAETWDIKPLGAELALRRLLADPQNEWLRAGAIYSLGEINAATKQQPAPIVPFLARPRPQELILSADKDSSDNAGSSTATAREVRAAARTAARMTSIEIALKGEHMTTNLSIIERIIFLKQVTFFQNMSIEQLKVLASICEEQSVPANTRIFQEGEPGGEVFMVVKGRVAIEREGDRKDSVIRLSTIEARSSFGEMSLFDDSPRNSSALSLEDSTLLTLRVEHLIALIRQYPDLSLELIKILSQRMREANDQIAHLTRSMPRKLRQVYDQLEDLG